MTVSVNGVVIADASVSAEMQYHPAADLIEARRHAVEALVVREVLRQAVQKVGLAEGPEAFDALLSGIAVVEPSVKECRAYFDAHRERFPLPVFELVEADIAAHLGEMAWRNGVRRFIRALVDEAAIVGVRFAPAVGATP